MAKNRVIKTSKKKRTTLFPPAAAKGDVPQVIIDKVNQFEEHYDTYRSAAYSEAQLRIDFLFYIGGRAAGGGRKFILEAKKPNVPIRLDPKPAFQLRRYAYSAKLPLSILTG